MCFISPNNASNDSSVVPVERSNNFKVKLDEVGDIFNAFDLDDTGFLTAAKIRHVLTAADIHVNDRTTTELVTMCDRNGDGRVSLSEFKYLLQVIGYQIVRSSGPDKPKDRSGNEKRDIEEDHLCTNNAIISINELPSSLQKLVSVLDPAQSGYVSRQAVSDVYSSLGALINTEPRPQSNISHTQTTQETSHHPHSTHGLGPLLGRVNHIALIVSDVGRSAWFYAKVLGLAQIRRPDFDEHGAWFTAGNVELHLIKGRPAVPGPEDLIVGHVSIEARDAENMRAIVSRLKDLSYPFRQNVSVPSSAETGEIGTNTSNSSDKIVQQFFVRDPDGYYVEVCNCDVLTEYCLCEGESVAENEPDFSEERYSTILCRWVTIADQRLRARLAAVKKLGEDGYDVDELAKVAGASSTDVGAVDEEMMSNFVARMSVYGDLCQNESVESLREILLRTGNDAIKSNEVISMRMEYKGMQIYQPPAFYEQDTDFTVPPCFEMKLNRAVVVP